jgi:restriction system protein
MTRYYRIMLGKKSVHAAECFAGGYIGSGFGGITRDVGHELVEDFREFNRKFIPEMQAMHPDASKIALGLWGGFAWTICKGIRVGDIVLCPDGSGIYRVGEVAGEYYYAADGDLPHRRPVRWLSQTISRADMSEALYNSTGAIGTVAEITKYADELQKLIGGVAPQTLISTDTTVEDATSESVSASNI